MAAVAASRAIGSRRGLGQTQGQEALARGADEDGQAQLPAQTLGGGQELPRLLMGLGEAEAGINDHLTTIDPGSIELVQRSRNSASTPDTTSPWAL